MNKTTLTSLATSNTSNSNINGDITQWNEARSSEEEDIKCSVKSHIETVNWKIKESSSEEEDIGIRKCRRIIQVKIMNREVKGWKFL